MYRLRYLLWLYNSAASNIKVVIFGFDPTPITFGSAFAFWFWDILELQKQFYKEWLWCCARKDE